MDAKIAEILNGFRVFDKTYKRELVDAAIERRAEIIPHLIKILENLVADPQKYVADQDLYDHIYAVMLLGHFREKSAHQTIVDVFSLPDQAPSKLYGDMVTEDLPVILLRTCGGSLDTIKSLVLNREAYSYCRGSAAKAMAYAVVEGMASREEVLAFFDTLFTGDEADINSDFWTLVAYRIHELYPEESMATIEKAYEDELIFGGYIPLEDFQQAHKESRESCLARLKKDLDRASLDDLHDSMSGWVCFQETAKPKPAAKAAVPAPKRVVPVGKKKKIGRNAPCPCGSGKKYKKCCLNKS